MTQEQVSEVVFTSLDLPELKKQFNQYKDKWGIPDYDKLVVRLKELLPADLPRTLWKYCKEYHPELITAVKIFKKRLEKKDSHICVEGETGSGKSTLTLCLYILLAYTLNQKVDVEKYVLYLPKEKELSKRLMRLKEYEVLWVDETIKSLNKMKYANTDVIESNELVQTERFRHNTVFYCVPAFSELAKSFRDINIKFRIWCYDATLSVLRVKEIDPDIRETFGAWHTNYRAKYKINKRLNALTGIDSRVKIEEQLPGFVLNFDWPNMEADETFGIIHLLYEVCKKRSRLIVASQEIPKDERATTKYQTKQKLTVQGIMRLHYEQGMTLEEFKAKYKDYVPMSKMTLGRYWEEVTQETANQASRYINTLKESKSGEKIA